MRFTTPQWRPSAAKRRTPPRNVIDVSAFASIMFALLFLMLGMTPPSDTNSLPVDLTNSAHSTLKPSALREDSLQVSITRDGTVFFRNARIALADLPDALRKGLRNGAENTIYIKADNHARYADVKAALDQIHFAGIQNVTFLTVNSGH
ncbi:MAG: biopolymer transporter ExbD [Candidatus Acidiferrum sp.]